jgi:hypothetical protein
MNKRRQRFMMPEFDPYYGYGEPEELDIPAVIQKYQYLQNHFKAKADELHKMLEEAGKKEKEKASKGRSFTALEQFQMMIIASAALGYIWYRILA